MCRAADFCAMTVDVIYANGAPAVGLPVRLIDPSGETVVRETSTKSGIRICDFGFGPHTLRVGADGCRPVSVSNLRLEMGIPIHLKIIANSCDHSDSMRNACLLYLRATSEGGRGVRGAAVYQSADPRQPGRADQYGRYQTLFRGSQRFSVTADGFETTYVDAVCRETEEVQVRAVMKPK